MDKEVKRECPECGSRKINTTKNPYFGGVIIDYTCKECGYTWNQDIKRE